MFLLSALPSYSSVSYKSLDIINSYDMAVVFEQYLGYLYESHGCLHFTPSDIYLLTETIPKGATLDIRDYSGKAPEFDLAKVPFFNACVMSQDDAGKFRDYFAGNRTKLIVYPSWNRLLITVNGKPFVQIRTLAGPQNNIRMPVYIEKGGPIIWDPIVAGSTDTGIYTIFASVKDYISSTYRENTLIPYGAEISKEGNFWYYNRAGKRYRVPKNVAWDLGLPEAKRNYNYFNIEKDRQGNTTSLKWGSHDFGKCVLLWTNDGKRFLPEMGYAEGELYFEQSMLVEDLAQILSVPGTDDLDTLARKNGNFSFYRELYEFIESKGKIVSPKISPTSTAYYKLYNNMALTTVERAQLDPRIIEAYRRVKENDLPLIWISKEQTLGLYNYLKMNSLVFEKYADFYGSIKKDWEFWKNLRIAFREDFKKLNILSSANQKDIIENMINKRLEFNILTEGDLNYYQTTSISSFFEQKDESTFANREREAAVSILRDAGLSTAENFALLSTDALNNYNFGLFLNDMLGNLYKSHGCLHVSPRDAYLLYSILPIGTKVTVNTYSASYEPEALAKLPYLAGLADIEEDVKKIKDKIQDPRNIEVKVYPATGDWIILLKKEPFARLRVLGGSKSRMKRVEYRDENNYPIFADEIAYPTTPGTFYVFKKAENYISRIYKDTTTVPMGSRISKTGGKWTFEYEKGATRPLPAPIAEDIERPADQRELKYYDILTDDKGNILEAKWSSHEFGKYSIITSPDKRTAWPELIHTSGELMFEQRQLVADLISILSTPKDSFDECVDENPDFDLYRECYKFVQDPKGTYLITPAETSRYKLYMDIPLTSTEEALIPRDAFIADKILKNKGPLTKSESDYLIKSGIAKMSRGKLDIDMLKILGINFETFQNVVVIQKYAHHFEVLKDHWTDLSELRQAMFLDFKKLLVKDPKIMCSFIDKLMMQRIDMKKITQKDVIDLLNSMLQEKAD